ncbi:MAG TPA: type II toxin-antitoxin system VapC family toxin [Desulfosporosinus sp.]|nr:type II toxin-antitoxin system VapC family toxin [Desulfosporosinus sp.]
MKLCVDTTILIDILKDEFKSFQDKLYLALSRGEDLVAPTVVYAELMPQFNGDIKMLGEFIDEHKINIIALDKDSAGVAAKAWMKYLKKRSKAKCPECGQKLNFKEHFLSDFYIGGFAITKCDSILTRDRGIYRKYFPGLAGYEKCLKSPGGSDL